MSMTPQEVEERMSTLGKELDSIHLDIQILHKKETELLEEYEKLALLRDQLENLHK